jgi:hypothetical protein
MAGTSSSRRERLLRDVEAQASRLECLVGCFAARLAAASARGMAREAEEARRMLALAAEVLAGLRGLRERLRRLGAGRDG